MLDIAEPVGSTPPTIFASNDSPAGVDAKRSMHIATGDDEVGEAAPAVIFQLVRRLLTLNSQLRRSAAEGDPAAR